MQSKIINEINKEVELYCLINDLKYNPKYEGRDAIYGTDNVEDIDRLICEINGTTYDDLKGVL